jgi:hypothetical protein
MGVECGDDPRNGLFVEAQAWVGVEDVEGAGHGREAVGDTSGP